MPIGTTHVPIPGGPRQVTLPDFANVFGGANSPLDYIASLPPMPNEEAFTRESLPGYVGTGVSYSQFKALSANRLPDIPRLSEGIQAQIAAPTKQGLQYGSWDLSYIDPLSSLDSLRAQMEGVTGSGLDTSPTAGGDTAAFLAEKALTAMPQPSRILDYGFSVPAVWLRQLLNIGSGPVAPNASAGSAAMQFAFQNDPAYWKAIPTMDDQQLRDMALREASRYSSQPAVLAQTLYNQFLKDRDTVTGQSSGNEHVDYLAKNYLSWVMDMSAGGAYDESGNKGWIASLLGGGFDMAGKALVSLIPGFGTPLAQLLEPVDPKVEAAWQRLDPSSRVALAGSASLLVAGTELVAFLPTFSGIGAVASLVRAGGVGAKFVPVGRAALVAGEDGVSLFNGMTAGQRIINTAREAAFAIGKATSVEGGIPVITGGKTGSWLYGSYQTALNLMNLAMAEGVGAAALNWTLEAALPSYAATTGQWIDQSAPFSGSAAAALIDQWGYLSSATFGVATLFRITRAGAGAATRLAGVEGPLGAYENRVWRDYFGGSAKDALALGVYRDAEGTTLNADTFRLSAENTIYQRVRNWLVDGAVTRAQRIADGLDPEYAALDDATRMELANEYLRNVDHEVDAQAVTLNNVLTEAHRPLTVREALWWTDDARLARSATQQNARELEARIAEGLQREYDATFWDRVFVGHGWPRGVAGYQRFLKEQASRLGMQLDFPKLEAALGGNEAEWRTFANKMVSHEFNYTNGELIAALEAHPALGLDAHPNDYVIMRSSHLFRDKADDFLAGVDQLATDNPVRSEAELEALKVRYLVETPELAPWFARYGPAMKVTSVVDMPLKTVADHIRSIYGTLPNRHHWWNAPPETADLPLNALARRLQQEGMYSIAYRNKEIVAYDPKFTEQANRVSQTPPEGYSAAPWDISAPGTGAALRDLAAQGPLDPDYWYVGILNTSLDQINREGLRRELTNRGFAVAWDPLHLPPNAEVLSEGMLGVVRVRRDSELGRSVIKLYRTENTRPVNDPTVTVGELIEQLGLEGQLGWVAPAPLPPLRPGQRRSPNASRWPSGDWDKVESFLTDKGEWVPMDRIAFTAPNGVPNESMWHATPALSKVLRDGLRSRYNLKTEAQWNMRSGDVPDVQYAKTAGPPMKATAHPTLREVFIQTLAPHAPRIDRIIYSYGGVQYDGTGVSTSIGRRARNGDTIFDSMDWTSVGKADGTPTAPGEFLVEAGRVGPQNIDEVWWTPAGRNQTSQLAWKREIAHEGGTGLNAGDEGKYVSVTYEKDHAEGIAERFRLGAAFAQGKVEPDVVWDHFEAVYRRIAAQLWAEPVTNRPLQTPGSTEENLVAYLLQEALRQRRGRINVEVTRALGVPGDRLVTPEEIRVAAAPYFQTQGDRIAVFVALDDGTQRWAGYTSPRDSWVGFIGGENVLPYIDPADVGVVQVFRHQPLQTHGAGWFSDFRPDEYELRFDPNNLWVVDPRVAAKHAGWRPLEPEPWRTNVQYGPFTELVSLEAISDRGFGVPVWPSNMLGKTDIEALAEDLRKNGMADPIVFEYSVADNALALAEGNHRLAAAHRLGWKEVPVTIIRREGSFGPLVYSVPLPGDASDVLSDALRVDYQATRYVPANLKPSDLQFTSRDYVSPERRPRWEQPWTSMTEDPAYGATPVYRPVSLVTREVETPAGRRTEVYKAPFLEYPSAANVYLGNRSLLGRKLDSVFDGWRTWRMTDYQIGQAHRLLGEALPSATPDQLDNFIGRIYRMSYEEWSPFGKKTIGQTPLPPQAAARLRADEVNEIGKKLLGEDLDYATILTRAFTQAWSLNMTAALTSRLKTFGRLGHFAILGADWLVPYLRYQASLIFRPSEMVESGVFDLMRGVRDEPGQIAAMRRLGISPEKGAIIEEIPAEPIAAGLTSSRNPTAPPTAGGLGALGGPFGIEDAVRDLIRGRLKPKFDRLWENAWNPNPYKDMASFRQAMDLLRRDLPGIIEKQDPGAYALLHETMKVPDDKIATFLAEDRVLYQLWQNGRIDISKLTEHAAKFNPALSDLGDEALQRLYTTEDWRALEGLLRIGAVTAQTQGFSTHFFGRYRSTLERTVNHPVLGVYPASWAYKAAKEWGRFLYDNRTFGDGALRLGMAPAVAMQSLIHSINVTVAQNTDTGWGEWMQNGPMANWFFLFNLVMPGDWNSIPFPLSRPIRTVVRELAAGRLPNPIDTTAQFFFGPNNRGGIGIIRDLNLAARGIGDVWNAWSGSTKSDQFQNLVDGLSRSGNPPLTPDWSKLVQYPSDPFSLGAAVPR